MRYSPNPLDAYPTASRSLLLLRSPEAWNLAWLSWNWEDNPNLDVNFTAAVHQTLNTVLKTGKVDLTSSVPDSAKVASLMRLPPPQAAHKLAWHPGTPTLPLYLRYGPEWLETLTARARMYREPHDLVLDKPVSDFASALQVIAACK